MAPAAWRSLRSRTWRVDDPRDLLDLMPAAGHVWLTGDTGIVASGIAARISLPSGGDRLQRVAPRVDAVLGEIAGPGHRPRSGAPANGRAARAGHRATPGPVAVGALPFSAEVAGEVVIPAYVIRRTTEGSTWLTVVAPAGAMPETPPPLPLEHPKARSMRGERSGGRPAATAGVAPGRPEGSRLAPPRSGGSGLARWRWAVGTALAEIDAGRLDKVVLARTIELVTPDLPDRGTVLRRLWRGVPGSYVFGMGRFVGASPELLVSRSGDRASSVPMAGTVRRGGGAAAEAARIRRLVTSAKDGAEHRVVVEAVAAGLKAVAEDVEVAPTEVVLLPTVAHLATRVIAQLGPGAPSALGLAGLLHPTPAVAGTPAETALALLSRLESFERGPYAGPVGWVDAAGDGEWAIALRCAWLEPGRARLYAGNGIVAGSDPDAEWDELEAKFDAMRVVLAPG